MPSLFLSARKQTVLFSLLISSVCAPDILCAEPSRQSQTGSQTTKAQTKQSAAKGAVLLIDTDDTCRLFIDDADKGIVTPAQSQKFSIGLGQHIVKCTIESIPDLLWRKVLEVKDSSQVAAAISLKGLHIEFDQAVTKARTQKADADATAQKELSEAEAEERARKGADGEVVRKMFEVIKGSWRAGPSETPSQFDFRALESGSIIAYENFADRVITKHIFKPVPPNRLEEVRVACVLSRVENVAKPGAPKDKNGWAECKNTDEMPWPSGSGLYLTISSNSRMYDTRTNESILTR